MVFDSNNNGLVHLIADNLTHTGLSQISFHDYFLLYSLFRSVSLLSDYCLDSGNILANLFDSACIVQLIGCILKSQIEKFFLSSY